MAIYKVPQDVEAEDKLLGPFSFKQFIFLIIAVAGLGAAYALSRLLLPLAIIPLPFAIFFIILALPIRKDQPMEIYLAAVVSFMTKPKRRLWQPDGIESLIKVIAPKVDEKQYGKGYNQEEVQRRLSYLANLVDSHGWSVRGVADPDSSMQDDLYNEAQAADDMLDDDNTTARQIDNLVNQADQRRRQEAVERMKQPPKNIEPATPQMSAPYSPVPLPVADPYQTFSNMSEQPIVAPQPTVSQTPQFYTAPPTNNYPEPTEPLSINPYPMMQQSIVSPLSEQPAKTTPATSPTTVSPAIIDLASNHSDLSIETLRREADRIEKKSKHSDDEVVISLH